jgi:PleD family two-component response regulator
MKIEPTRGVSGAVRGTTVSRNGRLEKKAAPAAAAQGQSDAPSGLSDSVEILGIPEAELTPKVRDALMSLMSDVADLRREVAAARDHMAHLERIADQDVLVPIANRRAFVRELSRAVAATERYGGKAAVVYFDVNGFKDINDKLGHPAGDAALHHIADILSPASVKQTPWGA